jgi:spectinomycin phosphotransferase
LHLATPQLGLDIPYVERFSLPFESDLVASLSEVEDSSRSGRPELEPLRLLILPRRAQLLSLLARLRELAEVARRLAPPQVLVHTDLHGGNLIRTPQDELYVVDWEGAMLAPAEHDLFIFAGEGFASLLAAYLRTYGSNQLHPELFAYYFHRRLLEDAAEFLHSLLHEDDSPQAFRSDLDLLASSCLAGMGFLDTSLQWAAAQIQAATSLEG